ncbi:MAG TPA: hypothetical protein VGF97_12975 [Rhizomicrobium sp.]|jgi:hypothetical protein
MKSSGTLIAAASLLALGGMSAQASCVGPDQKPGAVIPLPQKLLQSLTLKQPQGSDAGRNVVGTWLATYTVEGNPFGQAYIQWHSDGTEWENINLPLMGGNICMGSWKMLDSKHVYRDHWGWLYTDGVISGYFNETETDKVTHGGTYTGTNEQKIYDLNGNLQADVTGTSSAVKIIP